MTTIIKTGDLIIQVILALVCITRCLVIGNVYEFIWFYLVVGGWQVASYLVHFFLHPGWLRKKDRKDYGWVLFWLLLLFGSLYGLAMLELPLILFFLFGMLVIGPVMAVWYFLIGYRERNMIRHRSLIHLK